MARRSAQGRGRGCLVSFATLRAFGLIGYPSCGVAPVGRLRRSVASGELVGAMIKQGRSGYSKNPSIRTRREENQKAYVGFLLFACLLLYGAPTPRDPVPTTGLSLSLISGTRRVVYGDVDDWIK